MDSRVSHNTSFFEFRLYLLTSHAIVGHPIAECHYRSGCLIISAPPLKCTGGPCPNCVAFFYHSRVPKMGNCLPTTLNICIFLGNFCHQNYHHHYHNYHCDCHYHNRYLFCHTHFSTSLKYQKFTKMMAR